MASGFVDFASWHFVIGKCGKGARGGRFDSSGREY